MKLDKATVVVTGGASGLGLATARRLVAEGATVVMVDLPAATEAGTAEAKGLGPAATFVAADITSTEEMTVAVDVARDRGTVRGLVHCAGRGSDRLRILDREGAPAPIEGFAEVVRVNLVGTYNVLRLVAAAIAEAPPVDGERGACVLTASVAAFEGQIGQASYTAAKAGVHAITLVTARDLASRQIRVNTIAPGVFDTPMLGRLRDDLRAGLAASVPNPKRLGTPDEYAALAVHMLSNGYLNGETIRLDGAIRMAPR
ncbi:SDR family oxidoreductase [Dactylosporangium sp. NBC_01737]|uniref:SDR family NAD(P)-dependent oxidoreductase n=1 Tax=Dactylosporangium sp. NBC_01737 TaxID=2975959 RepID=UPI002E0D93C3|nr:SDR family oxidoreductase [Dactylosporangium sp. NBC_01737]